MKSSSKKEPTARQLRFAEAGILFVLALAVVIFVGVKITSRSPEESSVVTSTPSEAVTVAVETPEPETEVIADEPTPAEEPADITSTAAAPSTKPELPAVISYAEAEAAYFEQHYGASAELFSIYTRQHPDNAWGYYMLGLASWKNGTLPAAEEALRQALALQPDHQKSLVNLGRVLLEQERADEALPLLEKAVEIDPASADAYRVLGRIYHNLERSDEAVTAYQGALRLNSNDAWALNNLGLLYIESEQFSAALPPLARATELQGDVACFQNNLGMALERSGYFSEASAAYAHAVQVAAIQTNAEENLVRMEGLTTGSDLPELDLLAVARQFSLPPLPDTPAVAEQPAAKGEEMGSAMVEPLEEEAGAGAESAASEETTVSAEAETEIAEVVSNLEGEEDNGSEER